MSDFILFQCFGGFFSALSSQVLSWQIFGRFPVAVQPSDFVAGHCRKQGYVGNLPCKNFAIGLAAFELVCLPFIEKPVQDVFKFMRKDNHPKTLLQLKPSSCKTFHDMPSQRFWWMLGVQAFVMKRQRTTTHRLHAFVPPHSRLWFRVFADKRCTTQGTQSGVFVSLPKATMIPEEDRVKFSWDLTLMWPIACLCPTSRLQKAMSMDRGYCLFALVLENGRRLQQISSRVKLKDWPILPRKGKHEREC